MEFYTLKTTGRYTTGKRVWLFAKIRGTFAHVEVGSRAFGITA